MRGRRAGSCPYAGADRRVHKARCSSSPSIIGPPQSHSASAGSFIDHYIPAAAVGRFAHLRYTMGRPLVVWLCLPHTYCRSAKWPAHLRLSTEGQGVRRENFTSSSYSTICLGSIAKLRKATTSFVMSVRQHGTAGLSVDGFS